VVVTVVIAVRLAGVGGGSDVCFPLRAWVVRLRGLQQQITEQPSEGDPDAEQR
jgi:hypothetical protein